ncbi:MAG: hypothetical protein ACRDMV_00615 [Streptosporangiales bacterium]
MHCARARRSAPEPAEYGERAEHHAVGDDDVAALPVEQLTDVEHLLVAGPDAAYELGDHMLGRRVRAVVVLCAAPGR